MGIVRPLVDESENAPGARAVIEASPTGQWMLIRGSDLVGTFDSFDDAAERAVQEFGAGSYLVRTGAAPTVTLPSSVVLQGNGAGPNKHSRRAIPSSRHSRVS
jgi:hypothetical protein